MKLNYSHCHKLMQCLFCLGKFTEIITEKTGKLIGFSGPLILDFRTGSIVNTLFYLLNHIFIYPTIPALLDFKILETSIENNILKVSS